MPFFSRFKVFQWYTSFIQQNNAITLVFLLCYTKKEKTVIHRSRTCVIVIAAFALAGPLFY